MIRSFITFIDGVWSFLICLYGFALWVGSGVTTQFIPTAGSAEKRSLDQLKQASGILRTGLRIQRHGIRCVLVWADFCEAHGITNEPYMVAEMRGQVAKVTEFLEKSTMKGR